jgi:hypothetical protein
MPTTGGKDDTSIGASALPFGSVFEDIIGGGRESKSV